MTIAVGVVGASGFAGIEVVRMLLHHPEFDLRVVTSSELAGEPLCRVYPGFAGATDLSFVPHDDPALDACDVVFLAVPHTASLRVAPTLVARGATVIDLSADFRLRDSTVYERWYGVPHTAVALLDRAVFGLPELFHADLDRLADERDRGASVLVACAGCYPTATSLAAAPALRGGLVADGLIVVDAVSGIAGAGRKPTARTHFCFAHDNVEAYGVGTHRHTPEIEQILDIPGRLVFTPHLAPLNRGLLSTVTMPLSPSVLTDHTDVDELYATFYGASEFVQVLSGGAMPKTSSVRGTNSAHIGIAVNESARALVAVCALDNLGKGAAGQAIQCANIVCGLPEQCGLELIAVAV